MNKEYYPIEILENNKRRKALENIKKRLYGEIPETADVVDDDLYILETAVEDLEEMINAFCHMYDNPFNNHAFKNRETKKYGKIIKRKRH